MTSRFTNKFSIGLSLGIEIDEYKRIIDKYGDYIYGIYFSPPLGPQFHSRRSIAIQFCDDNIVKKFYKILELFRDNGFILDADLNVYSLNEDDIYLFAEFCKNDSYGITEVTALKEYLYIISDVADNIKMYNYSFNNFYHGENIDEKFETIVVGREFCHDFNCINRVIENGKRIKLLLNNGCSLNCGTCRLGSGQCKRVIEKNIELYGIDKIFALQTIFPYELNLLYDDIKNRERLIFKISNRTSAYRYLDKCLAAYTNNVDIEQCIKESKQYYSLFSRAAQITHHFEEIDYKKVIEYKEKIRKLAISGKNITYDSV